MPARNQLTHSRSRLIGQMLRLGLPMMVSMSALIGLGVTDTLMAGWASTDDLAALAMGSNFSFIGIMLLIGLQSIIAPRVSYWLGAGDQNKIRHDTQQAIWLGLGVGLLVALLLLAALPLIVYLDLSDQVETTARDYILIISMSMPLIGANLAIRYTIDGLGYTQLNMLVSLLAFAINLVLDYALVFGRFGFPALGAVGCAVATCAVVFAQSLYIMAILHTHPKIRIYQILKQFEWPQAKTLKRLALLGFPAAFAVTLEEGFFSATMLLAAPMGTVPLATHQIVLNIAVLALIIPIALGQAGAILVGASLGKQQTQVARQQVFLVLGFIALTMLCAAVLFVFLRFALVALYTADSTVIILGATIVLFCAGQLLVDGIQIGAHITLRGYQDTLVPALAQMLSYWLVGFPLGYLLTQTDSLGERWGLTGVWLAMLIALSCSAVLNVWRLVWISRDYAQGRRSVTAKTAKNKMDGGVNE